MMTKCNECKEPMLGRSDKRFCGPYCRSTWHNKKYQIERKTVRRINVILKRNRQILISTLDSGLTNITLQHLLELGFNFGFFTSIDLLKKGYECKYCYDVGYFKITDNTFKIKLKNKNR